jgi:ketosteroid isomerase-like protein
MTARAPAPASTATVAQELTDLCRAGKNFEAIDRLYSPDIVSIESAGSEDMPREMKGIDAIRGKNQWWMDNHEVHSHAANGPFVGEDQFAVEFEWDATHKPTGQRFQMSELALYTVEDGKIVRERFYYTVPGA